MNKIKQIFKKNLFGFTYFYSHLKYKVFVYLGLIIGAGISDSLGLALFMPLINLSAGANDSSEGLGGLAFITEGLEKFGIELTFNSVLVLISVVFVIKGILKFIEQYYIAFMQVSFIRKIRFQLIDSLKQCQYTVFSQTDAGRIQNTMSVEITRITSGFKAYLATMQGLILVVIYTTAALKANFQFAVFVVIGALLTNIIFRFFYKITKLYSYTMTGKGHAFQAFLLQSVQFFKYLKATNVLALYEKRLKHSVQEVEYLQLKIGKVSALLTAIREPLVILAIVLSMFVHVNVFEGEFSAIILSIALFYRSMQVLMQLQTAWNNYIATTGSLDAAIQLNKELRVSQETNEGKTFSTFNKAIHLNNIGLSFGEKEVLNNVNLEIPKNSFIALVGESGAGKTTLINVISGLVNPNVGAVMLDDEDLKDFNIDSYRNNIGYITQEAVIFNDSFFNNVSLWAEQTEENIQKVKEVLELVHLTKTVESLENGFDTILGDQGVILSGGQRQRISIARELFKPSQLLIFDEATSALDSETETIIQDNLKKIIGNKTVVMIAHRLSTIRKADRVVLLADGKIEDTGSFDELYAKSEKFSKMAKMQRLTH